MSTWSCSLRAQLASVLAKRAHMSWGFLRITAHFVNHHSPHMPSFHMSQGDASGRHSCHQPPQQRPALLSPSSLLVPSETHLSRDCVHFTDEDKKAQTASQTCPRSQSCSVPRSMRCQSLDSPTTTALHTHTLRARFQGQDASRGWLSSQGRGGGGGGCSRQQQPSLQRKWEGPHCPLSSALQQGMCSRLSCYQLLKTNPSLPLSLFLSLSSHYSFIPSAL